MKRAFVLAACLACGEAKPAASVEIPLPTREVPNGVYAIRFAHPSHVGERSRWIVTADEDRITTTRRGGETVSDDHVKKRGRLDAVATVLALDTDGKTSRLLFDVADLSYSNGGKELVHKKRGRLEIERAKREDDAKITFDGAEAVDDMREAAKLLLTLTDVGPDDDEVIGTTAPQRVGSHWRVDGKKAADAFALEDGGEIMKGAQVSGDAWLEGVGAIAGVDCLDVHAILHIDNLDLTSKMPGGAADVARITMTLSAKLPVGGGGRVADHQLVEATIKIRTPSPNGEITFETAYASRRDETFESVSPEASASR